MKIYKNIVKYCLFLQCLDFVSFCVPVYPFPKISYFLEIWLVFTYPLNIFTIPMCTNSHGILNLWSVLAVIEITIVYIHLILFYVYIDIYWFCNTCDVFRHLIPTYILVHRKKGLTKNNHCRLVSKNLFPLKTTYFLHFFPSRTMPLLSQNNVNFKDDYDN